MLFFLVKEKEVQISESVASPRMSLVGVNVCLTTFPLLWGVAVNDGNEGGPTLIEQKCWRSLEQSAWNCVEHLAPPTKKARQQINATHSGDVKWWGYRLHLCHRNGSYQPVDTWSKMTSWGLPLNHKES